MIRILIFLLLLSSTAHADTTTGLVGWWKLDEASGASAFDSSGAGNTGTLINSPTRIAGVRGNALSSDGTQYVTVGTGNNLTADLAVSFWIRTTSTNQMGIYGGADANSPWPGFEVAIAILGQTGKVSFYSGNYGGGSFGWQFSNSTVHDGGWHHIVVSLNNTTVTFYKDGVSDGSQTSAQPNTWVGTRTLASRSGGNSPLNGSIDDVRLYNRALTAQDVYQLYLSDNRISGATLRGFQARN